MSEAVHENFVFWDERDDLPSKE